MSSPPSCATVGTIALAPMAAGLACALRLLYELQLWKPFEYCKAVVSYLHKIMPADLPCGWVVGINASGCCSCSELAAAVVPNTPPMFERIAAPHDPKGRIGTVGQLEPPPEEGRHR